MTRQGSTTPNRFLGIHVTLIGLVLGLSTPATAQLPREQLYSLLSEANTTFQQANAAAGNAERAAELYGQAILLYEKIIEQGGIQNAKLYYNLANAYFLTNDLGRAILNYRRAEQLDRSDVNIRNNLAFARSQRLDKVAVTAEKRVLETLFFWHYDFSLRTKFSLACLFFGVGCIAVTVMLWLGRGPATTTVTVLAVILFVCFLGSVVVEAQRCAHTVHGVITASEIVARQGDGLNYPPSFENPLHAGTEFVLVEQRPGWLHIELSNGSDAWIPDDAAGLV
ncbi:MAG: tetratricopeptide repeat protein [Sedimentisphaerales bacterium]|nr:tetratricopeptide repeat protein [Sedimentisphaerales bacterium]